MTLTYARKKSDVRLTPEQYFYLCETNVLEGRTELINGKIVRMMSQYDQHAFAVSKLTQWASKAFSPKTSWVRPQMTLQCGAEVPEPDLAITRGPMAPARSYMTADRALLVVEVADSTLVMDTKTKPAIYARMAVPEYWVVDVKRRRLIVHRHPHPGSETHRKLHYAIVDVLDADASVTAIAAPKRPLKVGVLFGL